MVAIRDEVENFIYPDFNSDCLRWSRATNSEGRPSFLSVDRKQILVCRYLLSKKIGRDLSRQEFACHSCDNPWCVNIDHLWLGNQQLNMNDKVRKNRQWRPKGERHHLSKLTQEQVEQIRQDPRMYVEIAPDYGVSKSLIGAIKRNEAWKK